MVKHQRLQLFYNCDEKIFKGHKCKEQKLFHMDVSQPEDLGDNFGDDSHDIKIEETTLSLLDYPIIEPP
jgi:hypothetical protein